MMLSKEDGREVAGDRSATPLAPWAAAARYDRRRRRIVVLLSNELEFSIPLKFTQGLAGESASDLEEIEVSPAGLVLHWPNVKADLYLPALLSDVFGRSQNRWDEYWSRWQDKPQRSRSDSQSWTASRKVVT
ncbi:MAG: DUF2442 domain-containing protein [Steroidobacteraceae bacterium]